VRNQILPGSGNLVWRVNVMSNEDKIFTGGVNQTWFYIHLVGKEHI
jgi:hypothetical protein